MLGGGSGPPSHPRACDLVEAAAPATKGQRPNAHAGPGAPSFLQAPPASGSAAPLPWQRRPVPRFPAPARRAWRVGAGRALLGDRRREAASAARARGFHPPPTAALPAARGGGSGEAVGKPRGGPGSQGLAPSWPALPAESRPLCPVPRRKPERERSALLRPALALQG